MDEVGTFGRYLIPLMKETVKRPGFYAWEKIGIAVGDLSGLAGTDFGPKTKMVIRRLKDDEEIKEESLQKNNGGYDRT